MKGASHFAVESWAPEMAAPVAVDATPATVVPVDATVELAHAAWRPLTPTAAAPAVVAVVDGVRRVDARIWVSGGVGGGEQARQGICASYAAGAVRCGAAAADGSRRAELVAAEVERSVFLPAPMAPIATDLGSWQPVVVAGEDPSLLINALQERLRALEVAVARAAGPVDLLLVDGPLSAHHGRATPGPPTVGYVKTHHLTYLPAALLPTIGALGVGQRTPLFVIQAAWSRYSWYVRLPGPGGHAWAGVIRCELPPNLSVAAAVDLAEATTAALPRLASSPHKDPRAPQNLVPIGGLERELRRRLGDAALLERALRRAAAAS
jgi:hypothetical protein